MSLTLPTTSSTVAQYSREYLPRASKNVNKTVSQPVTPTKKAPRKQPASSGIILEPAEKAVGQLQSDRLSSPKKMARKHSPVLPSSPIKLIHSQPTLLESDDSQDVNDADRSDQDSITVWHGDHCPNCSALSKISELNFARLQHHFKYCATYCVFYQLMADLEERVMLNDNIKDKYEKLSPIFHSEQAHHLCQLLEMYPQAVTFAGSESSKRAATQLFKKAAELSGELLGPAETATFDCDRYEKYMRLLLEIAHITKADIELIGDIKMYLKPFEHNRMATRSQTNVKWDETFFDLKHSPEDDNFGRDLKEIMEPELGEKSFLIPTEYKAKCHGITG
jgi:hypothetical protein